MNKKAPLWLVFLVILVLTASAAEVSVIKYPSRINVEAGEPFNIYLNISNNFNTTVKVQIKDYDVIDNSGINFQCLEKVIPANSYTIIKAQGLLAYTPGNHTINGASVSFTNPNTGKEETISSNSITVTINGTFAGSQKIMKVQNIYECNGQNIQSTQMSISSGSIQQSSSSTNVQQNTQQKLNSMQQMNQNTEQLKQEMQEAQQTQQQKNSQLAQKIENSKKFQELNRTMYKEGYRLIKKNINAETNASGFFNYTYKNNLTGAKENIKGSMQNSKIDNVISTIGLKKALNSSKTYKEMRDKLLKQGFRAAGEPKLDNKGNFIQEFKNNKGEKAWIKGNYKNNKLANLTGGMQDQQLEHNIMNQNSNLNKELNSYDKEMQKKGYLAKPASFSLDKKTFSKTYVNPATHNEVVVKGMLDNKTITKINLAEKQHNLWWLMLIATAVIAIIGIFFIGSKKSNKKEIKAKPAKVVSPRKEALKLLGKAQKIYNESPKEAYGLCARAIRVLIKLKHGISEELTNTEALMKMKELSYNTHVINSTQEVFNISSMVEFAKYKCNHKEFERLYSLSRELVDKL